MATPYSYDLRQKVIQAIQQDGLNKCEASSLFSISRNTIDLWLKRQAQTGDFQAKLNRPPGNGHKITDWDKFREFVKTHGDKTQAEMAQLWEGNISARTISRAPTKNSDILTWPLNQSTFGRRDISVDEGQVKMSGFIVTLHKIGFTRKKKVWLSRTGRG